MTLNIPACCYPQGIVIWEPTKAVRHETKLATLIHSLHGVKEFDI